MADLSRRKKKERKGKKAKKLNVHFEIFLCVWVRSYSFGYAGRFQSGFRRN